MTDLGFQGSIPTAYERYLVPLFFEPYAADLAARARRLAPATVLETAGGTGVLARQLRAALPAQTTIVATDLSDAMLERARQQDDGAGGITWQQADTCALPFPDCSVDLVVCQFGLMFFPDRGKGLAEALRVLRPGGHCLMNVWQGLEENALGRLAHENIVEFFPHDPPSFYQVPFSMGNQDELRQLFTAAGFGQTRLETVTKEGRSPSALDVATGLVTGTPAWSALLERGLTDPGPVIERLAGKLALVGGRAPFTVPMKATIVSATRSSP
jgi:ubiquinone/menaquinone biosynthesis C-methylase UbiE